MRLALADAAAAAAARYLETQALREAAWAARLGLDLLELNRQSQWIACVDTLSLLLCGELKAPLELDAFDANGEPCRLTVVENPARPFEFAMSPWPFRAAGLTIQGEARRLPQGGRFPDEAAFRSWSETVKRTAFQARLSSHFAP